MKIIYAAALAVGLCNCSGANQALIVSGGPEDFSAMNRISEQYGSGEATAIVQVGDRPYKVWLSKSGTQIMVQTSDLGGVAVTGFTSGLTMGVVNPRAPYEPFETAAMNWLTENKTGCRAANRRRLSRVGYEWDVDCTTSMPPEATKLRR